MSMSKIKIADFAEVITGGTPSTSNPEYWENGDVPWLQSGACQNDVITGCDTFITQKGLENSAAKMMKPDSVLIALTGATTGKVGYLTFEACANQSVTGIQPNERFVSKYLYYYLRGIRKKILDDSYGGAQKHISQGYVKNIEVPLGSIEEQKTITKLLESVDTTIALRQQELQLLDDLIKARFVEMFGDCTESVPAGVIMKEMRNGVSPSTSGKYSEKVLTLSAITQGRFNSSMWKNGLFDSPPPAEKRVYASDFYMCRGNGNKNLVGAGAYSEEDREDLIFPDTVIAARIDITKVCMPYLFIAWMQPNVRDQIEAGARTTNGTYKINQQIISKVKVPLPSLESQKRFTTFVSQVDKSKVAVQKALDEAQLLFDSLMQQCFGSKI